MIGTKKRAMKLSCSIVAWQSSSPPPRSYVISPRQWQPARGIKGVGTRGIRGHQRSMLLALVMFFPRVQDGLPLFPADSLLSYEVA